MVRLTPRRLEGGARPARVLDLGRPPLELYLHGELPGGPAVAIVGTRWPTAAGARYARQLAGELGAAGVAILSGGARGIDAAVHRGALDVGGVTVVVAPSGLDRPYPPEHAALFREVLEHGGAYLSLAGPDARAELPRFHQRNEVLAALAHVVVVAEAPLRSGARHTARVARRLGRWLFAIPGAPWNERALGALEELRLGARLLMRAEDVLTARAQQRLHPLALPGAELLVRRAPRVGAPPGDRSSAPEIAPAPPLPSVPDGAAHLEDLPFALRPPPQAPPFVRTRRGARRRP